MTAPKKNCAKKFLGAKRAKQNLFESLQLRGKLFCFSVAKRNFSNYFSAHASFCSFLTLRKGHIKI